VKTIPAERSAASNVFNTLGEIDRKWNYIRHIFIRTVQKQVKMSSDRQIIALFMRVESLNLTSMSEV